jgi:hypothetical protein
LGQVLLANHQVAQVRWLLGLVLELLVQTMLVQELQA